MGGVCAKPSAVEDNSPKDRQSIKGSTELRVSRLTSVKRESFRVKDRGEVRTGSIDKRSNGSRRVRDDHFEKRRENSNAVIASYPSIGSLTLPKAKEGEQVAAGWPAWLADVAGEAINGWLPRRADTFEKLDKIGQGTYSSVYKARDLIHNKVVALKRVRFDNRDPESVKFMSREILILRRLDHPNIIKLEGLVTSHNSCSLYLVFEYMEHDLTGLASLPGAKFAEPQVKCYMQQLLSGLDHCHSRGVLHRDMKGSNLLIDNHGILKIADFGLASFFDHHHSSTMTSRVVTLWYRPPELLLGSTHYGVAVDLWSAGCILGELYAGKPIMPGRTEVEQLHKIFKLCGSPSEEYWRKSKLPHATVFKPAQPYRRRLHETFKDFPYPAIGLMEILLSIDPAHRGTAAVALKSVYFNTKPLPCDPSCLPKYPPSKEIDAKLRDEEAKRQESAAGTKGQKVERETKGSKEGRAVPAPDANAELPMSMKRRQGRTNSSSRSELFNSKDEAASGFRIEPPRPSQALKEEQHPPMRESFSGPLVSGPTWTKSGKKCDDVPMVSSRADDLSRLSGLVASRTLLSEDYRDKFSSSSQLDSTNHAGRLSEASHEFGHSRKYDHKDQHSQAMPIFQRIENGRVTTKEPYVNGHGSSKGNKIHFSGPLLASNNMEQMLKEHDRHIQEAARRARLDKMRLGTKTQNEGIQQPTVNSLYVSSHVGGAR